MIFMKKLTLIIICIAIASASAGVIAFAQKDETLSAEESSKSVSQDSSVHSSDELVKSLTVYKNVLRKYNYPEIWESVKCNARLKKDSGYYKKGDLVRIIGKYEDDKNLLVYTSGDGLNYIPLADAELLPLEYKPEENEKFNDMPRLPAKQVLEDKYVWIYRDTYGLPCYTAKDEYWSDLGHSLEAEYTSDMIVRYGKLKRGLNIYTASNDVIEMMTVPDGAYVGLVQYRYGEKYGMFSVYNNGSLYTVSEYIGNTDNLWIEVMPEGFVPSDKDLVYGLDEKNALRNYSVQKRITTDKTDVIKKVTPLKPLYFSFDDALYCRYNIISGDVLNVVEENEKSCVCLYNDRAFRISKTLIKEIK